jgi:ABC-type proline/glycine betaine transport system permease subunit
MEDLCRKTSLAMVSTAGDALILILTVLSMGLLKLKSEIISDNNFPVKYLIQHNPTFSYSGQ